MKVWIVFVVVVVVVVVVVAVGAGVGEMWWRGRAWLLIMRHRGLENEFGLVCLLCGRM